MSLLFLFVSFLFTASQSEDAIVSCHMDNSGSIEISRDAGSTWTAIGSEAVWTNELTVSIEDATASTVIRFTVVDVGGVGGFIANVQYEGNNYYTTNEASSLYQLVSASDGNMALVYTANGAGAWGSNALGGNIPAEAYWEWNSGTWNTLIFTFEFAQLIARAPSATVSTHIDNLGIVSVSNDDGVTWSLIGDVSNWQTELTVVVDDVTDSTIIRFTCNDVGVVGGFIANVEYEGINYPTVEPISSNYYELVDASDDDMDLVYIANGAGLWGNYAKGGNIPDDAYWVWNQGTSNSLTFDFRFDVIIDGSASSICQERCEARCEAKQATTKKPRRSSTQSARHGNMMYLQGELAETLNYSVLDGFMFGFACSAVLSMMVAALWYYWYYRPRKGMDYSPLN